MVLVGSTIRSPCTSVLAGGRSARAADGGQRLRPRDRRVSLRPAHQGSTCGADGIEEVGEIVTDATVIRVVRIDDVPYAVTDNGVTAYRLSDLSRIGTTA